MDFNLESIGKSPFAASVVGSIVGLKFLPGDKWSEKALSAGGGFGCAVFGTQLLVLFMPLPSVGVVSGISFMLGMLGMVVVDAVVKGFREVKFGEFFNSALQRVLGFFGKKEDKGEQP